MSTFTVGDLAELLRGDGELATEFLLGDEGFLAQGIVRQALVEGEFEITSAGWKVVRTLGYCTTTPLKAAEGGTR